MKTAYLDLFAGVSGDMMLGALVDLGVDLSVIDSTLRGLGLTGFRITASPEERCHIGGTRVLVEVEGKQPHRHLHHIERILDSGPLPAPVRERAGRVFQALTAAEAKVHRVPIGKVHLHEVGAVDAIVDVVGSCLGLHLLGIERVVCSPVVVGAGLAHGEHGPIPVPGPATLELLAGKPILEGPVAAEMTTPTGAALVVTLSAAFGPLPGMTPTAIGYGCGARSFAQLPNLLRMVVGEVDADAVRELAVVLAANLDDVSAQVLAYAQGALLTAGALDVWLTPATMKKGRAGQVLNVLAPIALAESLTALMLRETTTLGVRRHQVSRVILERRHVEVTTPWGTVSVKVGEGGGASNVMPEFDDCARVAGQSGVPVKDVQAAAIAAYRDGLLD